MLTGSIKKVLASENVPAMTIKFIIKYGET